MEVDLPDLVLPAVRGGEVEEEAEAARPGAEDVDALDLDGQDAEPRQRPHAEEPQLRLLLLLLAALDEVDLRPAGQLGDVHVARGRVGAQHRHRGHRIEQVREVLPEDADQALVQAALRRDARARGEHRHRLDEAADVRVLPGEGGVLVEPGVGDAKLLQSLQLREERLLQEILCHASPLYLFARDAISPPGSSAR